MLSNSKRLDLVLGSKILSCQARLGNKGFEEELHWLFSILMVIRHGRQNFWNFFTNFGSGYWPKLKDIGWEGRSYTVFVLAWVSKNLPVNSGPIVLTWPLTTYSIIGRQEVLILCLYSLGSKRSPNSLTVG